VLCDELSYAWTRPPSHPHGQRQKWTPSRPRGET
jgi:hypothetical protein